MSSGGLVIIIAFAIVSTILIIHQYNKLNDPSDDSVIYIDQIASVCNIMLGKRYRLSFIRQSGNPYKDDQIFDDLSAAINSITGTFKRAKIEFIAIDANSTNYFSAHRGIYSHRGRQEGKKLYSITIHAI